MLGLRDYHEACELRDGTSCTVRAIRPEDSEGVLDGFEAADRDAIYSRFFTYKKGLSSAELVQITEVDFENVVALVVTTVEKGRETLIGGGRYVVSDPHHPRRAAELAFMTNGAYRGRGVAPLLLDRLIRIARERGIRELDAVVLLQNAAMLSVFRRCGLPRKEMLEGDTVQLSFQL